MLKRVQCKKFFAGWLVALPVECGELVCHLNSIFLIPCLSHSCSITSANAIIRHRKRPGATLSPCLTPTSKGMEVSVFLMINLTLLLLYILCIVDHNFNGQPYFSRILIMRMCLEVSKAFTKSNVTQVGRLWLFRNCNIVLIVKLPSCHPTNGVDLNWYLTPCTSIILNSCVHRMLEKIIDPRSMSVTPRQFLGSLRFPLFGNGTTQPSCHSSKSASSCQQEFR